MRKRTLGLLAMGVVLPLFASLSSARTPDSGTALDRKVRAFLDRRSGDWRELNVPAADGRLLHDLILRNGYRRVLEIGTSTGHSAIWMAWALSKTGGRLITVEIDPSRHGKALRNFREAGVSGYIDARLGDAHDLVPALPGPFDLVFSDADKSWYRNYFEALAPKLVPGGCYATHNVSDTRDTGFGLRDYVDYVKGRNDFDTTFHDRGAGVAVSCKKRPE